MPLLTFADIGLPHRMQSWQDQLPGGLADRKRPTQFPAAALQQGRSIEKEHTRSPHLQTEIAMDHLTEDPRYYQKLKKHVEPKTASFLEAADRLVEKLAAGASPLGQPSPISPLQSKLKPGGLLGADLQLQGLSTGTMKPLGKVVGPQAGTPPQNSTPAPKMPTGPQVPGTAQQKNPTTPSKTPNPTGV